MSIRASNVRRFTVLVCINLTILWPAVLDACTGICIKPKDGSVIAGRTMEFGINLHSSVVIVPSGVDYVGIAPGGKDGLKWTTKYMAAGANMGGVPHIIDGLNEKGLSFEAFLFPGFAKYQDVPAGQEAKAMASWQLGTYILTTCATIDEAIAASNAALICDIDMPNGSPSLPAHAILRDAAGRNVVMEFINGKVIFHENPLGVITNSPPFEWHMINLRNYVNLNVLSVPEIDLSGLKLTPIGQGAGMAGLPGDFTPPSRFVRAVAFTQSALPVQTAEAGVLQLFHILNLFDIPLGSTRAREGKETICEYTQWTTGKDLTNRRYYFRTFDSSEIRMVDLNKCDRDAKEIRAVSMQGEEKIRDMTADQKPFKNVSE